MNIDQWHNSQEGNVRRTKYGMGMVGGDGCAEEDEGAGEDGCCDENGGYERKERRLHPEG